MSHAFVKFNKAYNLGNDTSAQKFIKLIQRLYELESIYKEKGYTIRQIYVARRSEETSRIEQELRSLFKEELLKESPKRSCYRPGSDLLRPLEDKNKSNKKYGKWLKIGLATGQAHAMCLTCRLVQRLTKN